MKPIVSAKERAWRARNPTLATKFDRLSAGAKANIRTNGFGKGTADLTKLADEYRRGEVKARSQKRRSTKRLAKDFLSLTPEQRSEQRDIYATDAADEALFWREYKKGR